MQDFGSILVYADFAFRSRFMLICTYKYGHEIAVFCGHKIYIDYCGLCH